MYDFKWTDETAGEDRYRELLQAVDALTLDEPDGVANMANVAALLWECLPDLNWAGFYRIGRSKTQETRELVLGPFVGRPACIRIPIGIGVCGAAAKSGETMRVEDVHAFPGHIACDAASQSELVVPIKRAGEVIGVIDLDSPLPARFSEEDARGIEAVAHRLADRIQT
jgi:GAF domain-containing protein